MELYDNIIDSYKKKYAGLKEFDAILKDYNNAKYLLKGNIAPDFMALDVNGNAVHLSDFIGKVVYIDVWSPFCAPCIHEFTFCHKLQDELKNKEIVFLSVCLDEKEDRWLSNIEKFHLKGTLSRAKDGWKSEIINQYIIKGVPRFLLIDKEGIIVSASAPCPSDASLKDLIKTYL